MSLGGDEWDTVFRDLDNLLSHGMQLINVHFTDGEEKTNLTGQMEQCLARMNKISKERVQHQMALQTVQEQIKDKTTGESAAATSNGNNHDTHMTIVCV